MKGENRLRRVLGPVQLSSLGIGAIIGTGIFVLTGVAAHDRTGTGTWFDLPAIVIAVLVTIVLVIGIKESAGVNTGIVILKVTIVLFVIVVGAFHVNPANWHPFAPFGLTGISFFGKTVAGQSGP